MKSQPPPPRRITPGVRFHEQIEKAVAEGADPADMTLRLTLGDVSLLKRDRTLAVADISFAQGVMRFLGVRIEQGGVAESQLVTSGSAHKPDGGQDSLTLDPA